MASTPLERFAPLDLERNKWLADQGKPEEQLLGYRTTGEYWGKQRAVVVTHNPTTARKQTYMLDSKLEEVRQGLLEMRSKVRARTPHWRDPDTIRDRYQRLCEHLHLPTDLFVLEFPTKGGKLGMRFRRDAYRLRRTRAKFGRNIVVSDNMDWSTSEIVQGSLERWQVEDRFRQSKNEMVSVLPLRHWTDAKIRCHLFTTVVAMSDRVRVPRFALRKIFSKISFGPSLILRVISVRIPIGVSGISKKQGVRDANYLRRIELFIERTGLQRTASKAMKDLYQLHFCSHPGDCRSTPLCRFETRMKTQSEDLSALGHTINEGGDLQSIDK